MKKIQFARNEKKLVRDFVRELSLKIVYGFFRYYYRFRGNGAGNFLEILSLILTILSLILMILEYTGIIEL